MILIANELAAGRLTVIIQNGDPIGGKLYRGPGVKISKTLSSNEMKHIQSNLKDAENEAANTPD